MNRIRRSRIIFVGFGVLDLLQNTVWPLTSKINMNRIRHNRIVFVGSVVQGLLQNTVWIVISELNTNRIRRNRIIRDSFQKTVWAGILEAHITWMDESLRNDIILVAFAVLDLLAKDKQPVMSQLDMNRMDSIKVRYLGVSRWKSEALAIHKTYNSKLRDWQYWRLIIIEYLQLLLQVISSLLQRGRIHRIQPSRVPSSPDILPLTCGRARLPAIRTPDFAQSPIRAMGKSPVKARSSRLKSAELREAIPNRHLQAPKLGITTTKVSVAARLPPTAEPQANLPKPSSNKNVIFNFFLKDEHHGAIGKPLESGSCQSDDRRCLSAHCRFMEK